MSHKLLAIILIIAAVLAALPFLFHSTGGNKKDGNNKGYLLLRTGDGLELYIWSEPKVKYSLEANSPKEYSGFLIMDVVTGEIYPFNTGNMEKTDRGAAFREVSQECSIGLEVQITVEDKYIKISGRVWDTSGDDRAIILRFQLPFTGNSLVWWEDLRRYVAVEEGERYDNTYLLVDNLVDKPRRTRFSRYPMSAVCSDSDGLSFAVPLDDPRICRLGYENGTCFIEYDFGLSRKASKNPSKASFTFIIYRIDPEWGFRDAVAKYYSIYPELFVNRVGRGGIIMPTGRITWIENPEDFHIFAHWEFPVMDEEYYIYNNEHGYLNLHYALPGTQYTVRVDREDKEHQTREYATQQILERLENASQNPDAPGNILFLASVRSMIKDENGEWPFYPHYPVYAHGGMVCPCNPDPDLFADKDYLCPNLAYYHIYILRTFPYRSKTFYRLIEEGEKKGFRIDGVGVDCMAWHNLEFYNHNEEHFPYADFPLTFHAKKPAIYNGISGAEYIKYVAELMRAKDRYVAANLVNKIHHPWYAPWIDIPITEIKKIPQPDSICCYKRTLYYQKPFCLLLLAHGSSFGALTEDDLLTYFHQATFWGFYPSFHDAQGDYGEPIEYYWTTPSFYNRDRELFKKYLPIIEELNNAGWEPVTYARSSNPQIYVERFGDPAAGTVYFTTWNDGTERMSFTIEIEVGSKEGDQKIIELISGEEVDYTFSNNRLIIEYTLDSHRTAVFKISW